MGVSLIEYRLSEDNVEQDKGEYVFRAVLEKKEPTHKKEKEVSLP